MKKFVHGDVIIKSINSLPKDLKPYRHNAVQYGEIQNHSHAVTGDFKIHFTLEDFTQGTKLDDIRFNGTKYLEVGEGGATISHEEHHTIQLPPGIYKCFTVREFDHFSKLIRKVAD